MATPEYEPDDDQESEVDCYQRELLAHQRGKQRDEDELRAAWWRVSDEGRTYRLVLKPWEEVQRWMRK